VGGGNSGAERSVSVVWVAGFLNEQVSSAQL